MDVFPARTRGWAATLRRHGGRRLTDTPAERGAESTWTRLRRRKVVQWGLAYVAGAWGLLQGLDAVTTFHWPEPLQQLATLPLLLGLPIVLVLAWYHGDRGQQRISTAEFAILTLLLLLGGGAFWYYQEASETATVASPSPRPLPHLKQVSCDSPCCRVRTWARILLTPSSRMAVIGLAGSSHQA